MSRCRFSLRPKTRISADVSPEEPPHRTAAKRTLSPDNENSQADHTAPIILASSLTRRRGRSATRAFKHKQLPEKVAQVHAAAIVSIHQFGDHSRIKAQRR